MRNKKLSWLAVTLTLAMTLQLAQPVLAGNLIQEPESEELIVSNEELTQKTEQEEAPEENNVVEEKAPEESAVTTQETAQTEEIAEEQGNTAITEVTVEEQENVTLDATTIEEQENVAFNKKVVARRTADDTPAQEDSNRPLRMAVDGIKNNTIANYGEFNNGEESAYMQIDLKGKFELSKIHLYRYWDDGRTYKGTVIVAGNTEADFKNGTYSILYNSDKENFHGFGAGPDDLYPETAEGKAISLEGKNVTARFIRIYMHGSMSNPSNHIVECEVYGKNVTEPYKEKAFNNKENYTKLPTYYDSTNNVEGQVSNPDIIKVDNGFNGQKYWMSYLQTAEQLQDSKKPYIVSSNDGITWQEAKSNNPITTETVSGNTEIVYDSINNRLLAYWVSGNEAAGEVHMKVSSDGVNWTVPDTAKNKTGEYATVLKDKVSALSVTYNSYKELFFIYYMKDGNLLVRWSKDGIQWSEQEKAVNLNVTPAAQDIQFVSSYNEYWALVQGTMKGQNSAALYMAKSKDGINWNVVGTQSAIEPSEAPFWNDSQIGRATFLYNEPDSKMQVWYGAEQAKPENGKLSDEQGNLTIDAKTNDSKIYRIGRVENDIIEVNKCLLQDEFYEEAKKVESKGFVLTAEHPVLNKGEKTKTTMKWSTLGGWGDGGDYAPSNVVSDMNVKFVSSDEKVATVDPWGEITAISDGMAIISGTTAEGSETEILITVGKQQKAAPRQSVSREKPLYIANYYWADGAPTEEITSTDATKNFISQETNPDGTRVDRDDPLKLWKSIPEDLKDNSVILLIAERSIKDDIIEENTTDVNAVRNWYKEQVEFCNKNKIPCAVQNINGETSTYDRIPLSFWKELADNNPYLVGFNGAELYNRFNGGQDENGVVNNADEYVADLIRMGAAQGVSMMWTDTNVFGNHGVLLDWLEEPNSPLASAMQDNSEYISMMYKESYGNPQTDALLLGLWLTGYCGNWGVASDWWHWQLDGNGPLFDAQGQLGGWGQTLVLPENMYSQDIIRVASMGGTAYKNEPQFYSVATNGNRTPAYQYSIMPTLQKVCSGEIYVPTKEEVLERTNLVVKGQENYTPVIYDMKYSNLYPKTGQYGIIPLVPNTVDNNTLKELGFEHIIETPLTEKQLKDAYPVEKYKGTAWAENYGKTWYMMNSSEDINQNQNAEIKIGETKLDVQMTPHTYAVVTENNNNDLNVILSNYRLDKSEVWDGTRPTEDKQKVYEYVWEMTNRMHNNKGLDKELRDTIITVNTEKKPVVTFKNEGENLYSYDNYTRPFQYSVTGETGNWKVIVKHNGFVEFTISSDKPVDPDKPIELSKDSIDKAINSINNAKAGEEVVIDMGDATVLPKVILETLRGKSVNVKLNMKGYTWTINGTNISTSNLSDLNLEVKLDTNKIPSNLIQTVAGNNPTKQLSITHNGNFGFEAVLTINVGETYIGKHGDLYYYNGKELLLENAGTVAHNGTLSLKFTHGFDYVIVMSNQSVNGENQPANQQSQPVKTGDNFPIAVTAGLMIVSFITMAGVYTIKQSKSKDNK